MFAYLKRVKEDRLLKSYLRDERELGPATQATLVNRLVKAVNADHPRIVEYCLKRGVSSDQKIDSFGDGRVNPLCGIYLSDAKISEPALIAAIRLKSFRAAEALIDGGADVNALAICGKSGLSMYSGTYSPLLVAVYTQNAGLVGKLLARGAIADVGSTAYHAPSRAPLILAVRGKDPAIIGALAKAGALNLDEALHIAEERENRDFIKIIQDEKRIRAAQTEKITAALPTGSVAAILNAAAAPANDLSKGLETPMVPMKPIRLVDPPTP